MNPFLMIQAAGQVVDAPLEGEELAEKSIVLIELTM